MLLLLLVVVVVVPEDAVPVGLNGVVVEDKAEEKEARGEVGMEMGSGVL